MLKFFEKFSEIIAIMSEKSDGSMKLFGINEPTRSYNLNNRKIFFQKNGINAESVVNAELAHGTNVEIISDVSKKDVFKTDGIVTKNRNIFFAITIADCIPVFFYEKEKGIIALVHAGWKGTAGNIAGNAIEKILELGGNIENIHVALGPGINICHFEIKEDVLNEFAEYKKFILRRNGKIFVDLKGIIAEQFLSMGIENENIENNSACTYCSENLFSFRRDKTNETIIAIIGKK